MSSVAEIRHHISAVNDTSKITRAMHLISSAKMRKAMSLIENNAVYTSKIRSVLRYTLAHTDALSSPYFTPRGGRNAAFLVIAADKGLCGGYNQDILKLAKKTITEGDYDQKYLFTVGYVACDYFQRLDMHPDVNYLHVIQDPDLYSARAITYELRDLYEKGLLDEVKVIYTVTGKHGVLIPKVMQLLPILPHSFDDAAPLSGSNASLVYHPSQPEALDLLVRHYLVGLVYYTLVQAFASEQRARMNAMEAATKNADEMLQGLRLQLNHARQSMITQELTEIISGGESVD